MAFSEFLLRIQSWLQSLGLEKTPLQHDALHAVALSFIRHSHLDLERRAHFAAIGLLRVLRKATNSRAGLEVPFGGSEKLNFLNLDLPEPDREAMLANLLAGEYTAAMTTYMNAPHLPQDQQASTHRLSPSSVTAQLWRFVRQDLGIAPYKGVRDFVGDGGATTTSPAPSKSEASAAAGRRQPKTIGAQVSTLYAAVLDDRLMRAMVGFFPDTGADADAEGHASGSTASA